MFENFKYKYDENKKEYIVFANGKEHIASEFEFNFFLCGILRIYEEYTFMKNKNMLKENIVIVDNRFEKLYISAFLKQNEIEVSSNYGHFNFDIQKIDGVYEYLCEYINFFYKLPFDIRQFDPIYISIFLWKRLNKIKKIRIEEIFLDDLYLPIGKNGIRSIEETDVYKTLLYGDEYCVASKFNSNHILESSNERIKRMLDSVKQHGYPYNNQYIILYNDENIIRDGQHRACCMRYLYGNIKVKVMRIIFMNNKTT